ncbi:MAG: hypothetical protein ABIM89_04165 [Mycobacteriales bacterium]
MTRTALIGTRYHLVVAPAHDSEQGAIEALVDHRVDGIVAISPLVRAAWLEELAARAPVVMVGRHDNDSIYDTVLGDDRHGAQEVMAHLLGSWTPPHRASHRGKGCNRQGHPNTA